MSIKIYIYLIFISVGLSGCFIGEKMMGYSAQGLMKMTEQTHEEHMERRSKFSKTQSELVDRMSETSKFYLPEKAILQDDSLKLLENLKEILTFTATPNNFKHKDSIQLKLVNHIFHMNFSPQSSNLISHYKDSMRIEFISYSPDLDEYFAIFTFQDTTLNDAIPYKGLFMICDKKDKTTKCFAHNKYPHNFSSREKYIDDNMYRYFSYMERKNVKNIWSIPFFSDVVPSHNGPVKKYQTINHRMKEKTWKAKKHIFKLSKHITYNSTDYNK